MRLSARECSGNLAEDKNPYVRARIIGNFSSKFMSYAQCAWLLNTVGRSLLCLCFAAKTNTMLCRLSTVCVYYVVSKVLVYVAETEHK